MHFVHQAAPDIRIELHKPAFGPQAFPEQLVEIAFRAFNNGEGQIKSNKPLDGHKRLTC